MEQLLRRGTILSGVGHGALILWVLLGDWLLAPKAQIEIMPTQVSMMSSAEFAALQSSAPTLGEEGGEEGGAEAVAEAAAEPAQVESSPRPPTRPEPQPEPEPTPEPQQAPEPVPEPTPEPAPQPEPPPEVVPEAVPQPDPQPQLQDLAQAPEEQLMPSMSSSLRPRPKPADRVAPTPVTPPEEAVTAETPQEAVSQEPVESPQPPQEARPEAVAEESGDILRTEATEEQDQALGAMASTRPRARPANLPPPVAAAPPAQAQSSRPSESQSSASSSAADNDADAIAAAVAAAASETASSSSASSSGRSGGANVQGPPLSGGEIGDIRSSIGNKWNLGAASTDVMNTIVVIRVEFDATGKPIDIKLLESQSPSAEAESVAFAAGRRAIQRAYIEGGIPLPADKYETWKVLEFVFDANGMRMR